jgi:hypothetical protein
VKMVKYLLSKGAEVNQHDESIGTLWTPLHRAMVQVGIVTHL